MGLPACSFGPLRAELSSTRPRHFRDPFVRANPLRQTNMEHHSGTVVVAEGYCNTRPSREPSRVRMVNPKCRASGSSISRRMESSTASARNDDVLNANADTKSTSNPKAVLLLVLISTSHFHIVPVTNWIQHQSSEALQMQSDSRWTTLSKTT